MKLRDLAEILFTNALIVGFVLLIWGQSHAADPLRHISAPGNTEAMVLTNKPCTAQMSARVKPEYAAMVFHAIYVWKDGRSVNGCYMEIGDVLQAIFDDGDEFQVDRSGIKSGPPIFGDGV